MTSVGVVIGLAVALSASRLVKDLLFGVAPTDPLTYAAIAALLLAVAVLATLLPARRATRVNPVDVLRV